MEKTRCIRITNADNVAVAAEALATGEKVRIEFLFSNPTDLLWFKFRYG